MKTELTFAPGDVVRLRTNGVDDLHADDLNRLRDLDLTVAYVETDGGTGSLVHFTFSPALGGWFTWRFEHVDDHLRALAALAS